MTRFIMLSFGFLGWAFYEMSGGTDFESASDKIARLSVVSDVKVAKIDDTPIVSDQSASIAAKDVTADAQDTVTRVSVNLTDVNQAELQATAAVATSVQVDSESGVRINTDETTSSGDTPAIIPSLITPNDSGSSAVAVAVASSDLRKVSGNRVNVRGGPSTDFDVVSRLVRGDTVEVIEDNGNGWVLMRAVNSGAEGWMADFLLTSG